VATTVLLVDDHAGFRSSARRLLELDGFEIVGEAPNGSSALELARTLGPELVVLDVSLPDMNGFEVAERLRGRPLQVILVSNRNQKDFGQQARRRGALGVLAKEHLSAEAVRALLLPGEP
jgi:DNA-binding NarL/FixJ family response regulator